MKKGLLFLLCLLISCMLCIPVLAEEKTVATAGFENGTEGWRADYLGSAIEIKTVGDTAKSGNKSLQVTGREEDWDSPGYSLNTLFNANGSGVYQFTAYLKLISGEKATPRMLIRQNQTGEGLLAVAQAEINTADWTLFSGEVTVADSLLQSGAALDLCFDGDKGDFYLDDMTIIKKSDEVDQDSFQAWKYTLAADDFRSDGVSEFYLNKCKGHYSAETDQATIYIQNTSEKEQRIEVAMGWDGTRTDDIKTMIHSGYMKLAPGETVKYVLAGLSGYREKANDDLGYVPDSTLGESSVVRIISQTLQEGDSFVITGFTEIGSMNNQAFTQKVDQLVAAEVSSELPQATKRAEISASSAGSSSDGSGSLYTAEELLVSPSLVGFLSVAAVLSMLSCIAGIILHFKRECRHGWDV